MSGRIIFDRSDRNVGRKFLSELVAVRTYAETKQDGKKETHYENVERVIAMHCKRFPSLEDPIRNAFKFVHNKKVLPSMRQLQNAGYAIERSHARGFNCTAVAITSFKDVADAMWLSMNGCGVGFSVQWHHVGQLPTIVDGPADKITIEDTKEAWAESIADLLRNPSLRFNYSQIRPEGATLSTGGTASGPKPLRDAHERIRKILKNAVGRKLRPIEVHDIICHQSDAVVVGGVRRAALISLFDFDDKEMMLAKGTTDWRKIHPQRERANNSVVLLRSDPALKQKIRAVMDACYESYSGEPGLLVVNCAESLVNPCIIATETVLTPDGIRTIADIDVGSIIWSGQQWTRVIRKIATGIKPVHEYVTRAGSLCLTEDHRIVQNGEKIEIQHAETIDKVSGPAPTNIEIDPQDVVDGLVLGDGTFYKSKIALCVGSKDGSLLVDQQISGLIGDVLETKVSRNNIQCRLMAVTTTLTESEVPKTYDRRVPDQFLYGTPSKVLGFLRGLYSANGSVTNGSGSGCRVTLKAASFFVISAVQKMLSSVGISSYYTINKEHDVEFDNGTYTCKQSYDLNISTDRNKFLELIGFIQPDKQERLVSACKRKTSQNRQKQSYEIVEKRFLGDLPVFDITVEADEHTYWSSGLLVSNCGEISLRNPGMCNLVDINAKACTDERDFIEVVGAATIIGTLQASYTDFHFLHPKWKKNVDEEALLGVSITGQAENWKLLSAQTLRRGAAEILAVNEEWAVKIGINASARNGCTKPSGSASTYLGCTAGIHGSYDKFFIRRMQIEKISPVARYLIDVFGIGEPGSGSIVEHHYNKDSIIQVAAPHVAPDAIIAGEESAVELLERALHIKKNWIEPSHRSGPENHNVSLSCYYREFEREIIKDWLCDHSESISGIAFFPHSGGTFKAVQMPYESITESEFMEWTKKFDGMAIDLNEVDFSGTVDERKSEPACAGNVCETSI